MMIPTGIRRNKASVRNARKLHLYETLYSLNAGFQRVIEDLRELERAGLFRGARLRHYQKLAEELRAATNRKLTEALTTGEERDCRRLGGAIARASKAPERRAAGVRRSRA